MLRLTGCGRLSAFVVLLLRASVQAVRAPVAAVEPTVLVLTYNHGEACGSLDARAGVVDGVRQQIIEANQPDIVVMSVQERRHGKHDFPLGGAITELPYTWIGASYLTGRTKVAWGCSKVDTAVLVAVRNDAIQHVNGIIVDVCNDKSEVPCTPSTSGDTHLGLYMLKGTKGMVAAHLNYNGVMLHFVGVHLDTKAFLEDLKKISETLGIKHPAGVTFIAGDFNNRIDKEGLKVLCSVEEPPTKSNETFTTFDTASFQTAFCMPNDGTNDYEQKKSLQINKMRKVVLDGMSGEKPDSIFANFVSPARATIRGQSCMLPTYKYRDTMAARESPFDELDKEVACRKGSIGVLDHVMVAHSHRSSHAVTMPPAANFKLFPGSDHAMISAKFDLRPASAAITQAEDWTDED